MVVIVRGWVRDSSLTGSVPAGETDCAPDLGGHSRGRRSEVAVVVVEPGEMVDAVVEDV